MIDKFNLYFYIFNIQKAIVLNVKLYLNKTNNQTELFTEKEYE